MSFYPFQFRVVCARPCFSFRHLAVLGSTLLLLSNCTLPAAEDREAITREDRKIAEAGGAWVYNDLDKGFELAKQTGKPLLIIFRCPP